MAVKYVREDFRDTAKGDFARLGNPNPRRKISLKQKLLYIYIGLGTFSAFLLVFHLMGIPRTLAWGSTTVGTGVIINKLIENEGTPDALHVVTIGVTVTIDEREEQLLGQVPTDEHSWGLVEQRSPVTVQYQLNKSLRQIRIVGITQRSPS